MNGSNPVFLAWQSPESREWHVVGALSETGSGYEFHYTKGALRAEKFVPFSGMDNINKSYVSEELFPLFYNRLLSQRRPEYPKFIEWLGLKNSEATPLNILARSGGMRGTDQLQVFRRVEIKKSGEFEHFFFAHGLSHMTESAQKRIELLAQGDKLFLCLDCQNDNDSKAILIRVDNPVEAIGYCPRYLAKDIQKLMRLSSNISISVESVSQDAPSNYRILCKLEGVVEPGLVKELEEQDEYKHTV
ncbi:restriction endonuclease [Parashewanella curva]|uniref:Restriction endonuclease n=1 Tax=Parashewanella curva TaxID=2338552 RepID=A0A3L8PVC2_9GAMM|nr:HIRAN domain-containing protein [Parashewanella curva]RLV58378.1 restriction endonuclease [Parashewanella curva]